LALGAFICRTILPIVHSGKRFTKSFYGQPRLGEYRREKIRVVRGKLFLIMPYTIPKPHKPPKSVTFLTKWSKLGEILPTKCGQLGNVVLNSPLLLE
jgi:hypothetical protein